MKETMAVEQNEAVVKWMIERENTLFDVDNFKRLGKDNDFNFQVLVFMGRASQQMSLGYTIAYELDEIPQAIKSEMLEVATRYHELQSQIRELSNKEKPIK